MPPFMDFNPDLKLPAEALAQIARTRHARADQFGDAARLPETSREMPTRTRASHCHQPGTTPLWSRLKSRAGLSRVGCHTRGSSAIRPAQVTVAPWGCTQ